jgi:hypothetical protein
MEEVEQLVVEVAAAVVDLFLKIMLLLQDKHTV